MKLKKRFEQIEIPDGKVPEKQTLLQRLGLKRNLELGHEARDDRIRQETKRISDDLEKQVAANDKRREEERKIEATKELSRQRKEKVADIELKEMMIKERQGKARQKIYRGILMASFFLGIIFLTGGRSVFFGFRSSELIIGIAFAVLSYFFRGRR